MSELQDAPYVSLATFRKTGAAVATPVWCAYVDNCWYIFSAPDAGKVKRLRNSHKAQLAICDIRGKLLGEWHEASAELFDDAAEVNMAHKALRAKYGWQMTMLDIGAKIAGRFNKRQYIRVQLNSAA